MIDDTCDMVVSDVTSRNRHGGIGCLRCLHRWSPLRQSAAERLRGKMNMNTEHENTMTAGPSPPPKTNAERERVALKMVDGRTVVIALWRRIGLFHGTDDDITWELVVAGDPVEIANTRHEGLRMMEAARNAIWAAGMVEDEITSHWDSVWPEDSEVVA